MEKSSLQIRYAVMELRRNAPEFIDNRGKILADLLADYHSVDSLSPFGSASPANAERFHVQRSKSRAGAVAFDQAIYEDQNVVEITEFLSEAPVFLKRCDRLLRITNYDRVGIRFRFFVDWTFDPTTLTLARFPRLIETHPGLSLQHAPTVVLLGTNNDWNTQIFVSQVDEVSEAGATKTNLQFDIDQWRTSMTSRDVSELNIAQIYAEAKRTADSVWRDWDN